MKVLNWLSKFNNDNLFNILLFVLIGTGITVIVQSSAATMVMVLTMAYNGYLGVNAAAALILGSNIGTTITAFLASIGTSTAAKRTAMAHIMFNVIGTLVTIIFFRPMMYVCNVLTPGNIYTMTGKGLNQSLPTFLAMFHTLFNLFNTLIFFPFVKPYAKLIEKMVPDTAEYDEGTYHFRYIGTTLIDSPEVYMLVIRDEIKKMADLACNMFSRYRNVFNTNDVDMDNEVAMMKKQEEYADQMQEQLSDFCVHCIQDSQTPTNASSLNCLIRVMDELESVTDSCYNLIILSQRQFHQGWKFEEETARELQGFEELVQAFLNYVRDRMDRTLTKAEMQKANEFEFQINEWRNRLSQTVQEKLSDGKADVKQELLVLEKIRHLEHIGDYCTNIAEAYHQAVKHTPVLQRRSAG
jgi:phosphate:Na+ symporter